MSIVGVSSSGDLEKAVNRAAGILSSGGLVAYPTESFYGLAADIADADIVGASAMIQPVSPTIRSRFIWVSSFVAMPQRSIQLASATVTERCIHRRFTLLRTKQVVAQAPPPNRT